MNNYPPGFDTSRVEVVPCDNCHKEECECEEDEEFTPIKFGSDPKCWVSAIIYGGIDNVPLYEKRQILNTQ